jgi:hypothetical protein
VITAAQGAGEEACSDSEVFVLSSETTESALAKGITIEGCDHVTFTLHSGESTGLEGEEGNASNFWGWSCTVRASAGVYEFAATVCSVPDADLPLLKSTVERTEPPEESTRSTAVSTLAHGRQPGESSRACLDRQLALTRASTEASEAQSKFDTALCELVRADGSLLSEDSISTPYAHAVCFTVEHAVAAEEESPAQGRRLVVMEGTPVFSARDGAAERSGMPPSLLLFFPVNTLYMWLIFLSFCSWPVVQVVPVARRWTWCICGVRRRPGAVPGVRGE